LRAVIKTVKAGLEVSVFDPCLRAFCGPFLQGFGQGMSQTAQEPGVFYGPAGRSGNGDLQARKEPDRLQIGKKVALQAVIKA
jgi:hypothetical protein